MYLFVVDEPRIALGFLVGFLGLLRIEEILGLQFKHVHITRTNWAILSFPDCKGSKLKGEPETVIIKDRLAVGALSKLLKKSGPDDFLVGQTYRRASICTLRARQRSSHISRLTPWGCNVALLSSWLVRPYNESWPLGRRSLRAHLLTVPSPNSLSVGCRSGVCCVWRMQLPCFRII